MKWEMYKLSVIIVLFNMIECHRYCNCWDTYMAIQKFVYHAVATTGRFELTRYITLK